MSLQLLKKEILMVKIEALFNINQYYSIKTGFECQPILSL